jgi:hypothetical protein
LAANAPENPDYRIKGGGTSGANEPSKVETTELIVTAAKGGYKHKPRRSIGCHHDPLKRG